MQLERSLVRRGGVTANYWYGSTSRISAYPDAAGALCFNFQLPSKGGGTTEVHLAVAATDLRTLLKSLATAHPELADMFTECAHEAVTSLPRLQIDPKRHVA